MEPISRRQFLSSVTTAALAAAPLGSVQASAQAVRGSTAIPPTNNFVELSQIHGSTEQSEHAPGPFLAPQERIGFAIVGLGRLAINQILPAFSSSKYCRPVALVSGDRQKAIKVAAQYGIQENNITDYKNFENLAHMQDVDVIYIVLPNSMHHEFVLRSAKLGRQVLCEKPMANSGSECREMIAACKKANVKLMIAYRQQYEPMNRKLEKMVQQKKLGKLNSIVTTNSQNTGDPSQWRLKRALAGGGCLPDVGIYCLNAARFLSGEEPISVQAITRQPQGDPRFIEVESHCSFTLRFPSGLVATCVSAYDVHRSTMLRLQGSEAWAEMSPAFGYHGSKLKYAMLTGEGKDAVDTTFEPGIEEKDQFASEMDHFAECVRNNQQPHSPGEEGLQDQLIIEAIYKAASTGQIVSLQVPNKATWRTSLPESGS